MEIKNKTIFLTMSITKNKSKIQWPFISFFLFFTFNTTNLLGQQTFSYTQYMNHPLPLNMATSLQDAGGSINLLVRKQWVGIDGAPSSFFVDGFLPIKKLNGTAGIIAENDKYGPESLTEFNAFYAQSVKLGETQFLGLSLNLGLRNYIANYTQLNPLDPALGPNINEIKPSLGFSLLYYSKTIYLGLSVPELTIRNLGKNTLLDNNFFRNNYFFMGGLNLKVVDGVQFKPASLVSYSRGVPPIADFSVMFLFGGAIGAGLNYRTNNESAIIITTDFNLFKVGYSYQFGLLSESLGRFIIPTQEITLSFRLGKKKFDSEKIKKVF